MPMSGQITISAPVTNRGARAAASRAARRITVASGARARESASVVTR
jgi:hypothetical protein